MKRDKVPQSWNPIEAVDLNKAEERWIQTIQQNCFSEELRVINNADVPEGSKTPLLLPAHHRFTELLIQSIHSCIFHNGIRETPQCSERKLLDHPREGNSEESLTEVHCVQETSRSSFFNIWLSRVTTRPSSQLQCSTFCQHWCRLCGASLCKEFRLPSRMCVYLHVQQHVQSI